MRWSQINRYDRGWESHNGHHWRISTQHGNGRVLLKLAGQDWRGPTYTDIADCASIAEAEIFATAMDMAEHPTGMKVGHFLAGLGMQEAPSFSRDLADELMQKVRTDAELGDRYWSHARNWFASTDMSTIIASTQRGPIPICSFVVDADRMAKLDTILIEPRISRGVGATPVIPTFAAAYLEIMNARVQLNGSHLYELADGQQDQLVERFAAGYVWPEPMSAPEQYLIGMRA